MKCDTCDGEDGPASAKVRLQQYDGEITNMNLCKQCFEDQKEDIVVVLERYVTKPEQVKART